MTILDPSRKDLSNIRGYKYSCYLPTERTNLACEIRVAVNGVDDAKAAFASGTCTSDSELEQYGLKWKLKALSTPEPGSRSMTA